MKFDSVYSASPIDWEWELSPSVEQMKAIVKRRSKEDPMYEHGGLNVEELEELFEDAKEDAREVGWEGDMVLGPVVFTLPDPHSNSFAIGFAWKQSNNGTTFIFSPFELPWLKDYKA